MKKQVQYNVEDGVCYARYVSVAIGRGKTGGAALKSLDAKIEREEKRCHPNPHPIKVMDPAKEEKGYVTLEKILTQKRFRKMDIARLVRLIEVEVSYTDYKKLPGEFAHNKAAKLYMKLHPKKKK